MSVCLLIKLFDALQARRLRVLSLRCILVLTNTSLQAMDRERASLEDELLKERAARKQQDESMRNLESQARSSSSLQQSPYNAGPSSPDKRKVEVLEKQVAQLKQDKQREEMQRLEAESTLKAVERRANDLQHQVCLLL